MFNRLQLQCFPTIFFLWGRSKGAFASSSYCACAASCASSKHSFRQALSLCASPPKSWLRSLHGLQAVPASVQVHHSSESLTMHYCLAGLPGRHNLSRVQGFTAFARSQRFDAFKNPPGLPVSSWDSETCKVIQALAWCQGLGSGA